MSIKRGTFFGCLFDLLITISLTLYLWWTLVEEKYFSETKRAPKKSKFQFLLVWACGDYYQYKGYGAGGYYIYYNNYGAAGDNYQCKG